MEIKAKVSEIKPRATNTAPDKYQLTLRAEGSYAEIEWLRGKVVAMGTKEAP